MFVPNLPTHVTNSLTKLKHCIVPDERILILMIIIEDYHEDDGSNCSDGEP